MFVSDNADNKDMDDVLGEPEETQLSDIWPLADLQVHLGPLILKPPTDQELAWLAQAAHEGVHNQEEMPFETPWNIGSIEDVGLKVLQYSWKNRAEWRPKSWRLDFIIVHEGTVIGMQSIGSDQFGISRAVHTGSWISIKHHGHGLGTLARLAVLGLAFEYLGALTAKTGWQQDNVASARVSEKIGYAVTGTDIKAVQGHRITLTTAHITVADWHAIKRPQVAVQGFDACRSLFGVDNIQGQIPTPIPLDLLRELADLEDGPQDSLYQVRHDALWIRIRYALQQEE